MFGKVFNKIFGGGKVKTDWEGLERYLNMQNDMGMKNNYGIFSDQTWEQGEDGRWGRRHTPNEALMPGLQSLMERYGSGPRERVSTMPSQLNQLLDARMAHQFDRMGMQYGQGPDQGQYGPPSGQMFQQPQPQPQPQPQQPGPQMQPQPGPQQGGGMGVPPAWAQNQRLDPNTPFGALEAALDQQAVNRTLPEDQRRNLFRGMFG